MSGKVRLPRRIVILGPQGSGKGAQAELLAKRLRVPAVSMGDLLRQEIQRSTAFGRQLWRTMHAGQLVPNRLVNRELVKWFRTGSARRGFVLDGYPRTRDQIKTLDRLATVDLVLVFDLTDQEAIRRLAGRRVSGCGKVYHLLYNPPPKNLRCKVCGDRLVRRHDDSPKQIRKRLAIYHRATEPVIREYERRGLVRHFDARPAIAVIGRRVVQALRQQQVLCRE